MAISSRARKHVEKQVEKFKKKTIEKAKKIIDKGTAQGAEAAVRDFDRFYDNYVQKYYRYKPKVYRRNLNLRFTLIGSLVHKNTGNITFIFSNSGYDYPPYARTNPDMVFDSFMSGSRYSNAAVMKADPKHFGTNVVRFEVPEGKNELLKNMQGKRYVFQDFLSELQEQYPIHLRDYLVLYFRQQWKL